MWASNPFSVLSLVRLKSANDTLIDYVIGLDLFWRND